MWKLVGEWKRVESLSKSRPSDRTHRQMLLSIGDAFAEEQEWTKARAQYEKADDAPRLVHALLMLEDYSGLEKLTEILPEHSPLLPKIGAAFEAVGLTTESVKTYLACGMAEKAVETAVVLSQWNLAMELAQKHSLHNVAPVLLRYTGHLLENGEIMQAVEPLRKSDKPFAAGKLLAMVKCRFNNVHYCHSQSVVPLNYCIPACSA
jgi:WD repeat-containing protein 35